MKKLLVILLPAMIAVASCSRQKPKTETTENKPQVSNVKPVPPVDTLQKVVEIPEAEIAMPEVKAEVSRKQAIVSDHVNGDVKMPADESELTINANEFTIGASSDTTIYAVQGTRVLIKKETFQFADGTPVTGPIIMEIKEYYKKSEMLLADLSTSSNGQLLETGGMLNINATSEGKIIEIKKDKQMTVYFPTTGNGNRKMNLFYPDKTSTPESVSNWVMDNASLFKKTLWVSLRGYYWPGTDDQGSSRHTQKTFMDTGYYWNPDGRYNSEYNFSKATADDVGFGSIRVEFIIDIDGKVIEPVIKNNVSEGTRSELLSFLKNLPEFKAGKDKKGNLIQGTGVLIVSAAEVVPGNPPKEEFIAAFEKKYAGYEAQPVRNMAGDELNYYIFSIAKLGWINCDRFIPSEKKTDYIVKSPVDGDIKIKMVFKDIDGVLMATEKGGKYIFPQVPVGKQVTIVAIKDNGGNLQTAFQDLTISDKPLESLAFKETTLAELRQELEKLN